MSPPPVSTSRALRRHAVPTAALRGAAAAILVAALLAACGNGQPVATPPEPRAVRVAPATASTLAEQVSAVGLLAPKDEARLSFKVGGVVESVRVEEGAPVRRGQVLASLKQAEIESSVAQAREAADKARRDLARAKALYADGVTTEEQVQDLTTAYRVAQAALDASRFNARYARIEAPADGVVMRRLADPDELVQPGQTVLVVGGTGRGWIVKTALADRDVVHVAAGDAARIALDAYPGRAFAGRVTLVSSAADPATGTFPVEVEVDPADARLVQGLVAKVALERRAGDAAARPAVPVQALLEANGDRAWVFVFEPSTRTVQRVAVQTGRLVDAQVEVLAGLDAGQQVVVDGAAFLDDGEAVRLADVALADASTAARAP